MPKTNEVDKESYTEAQESEPKTNEIDKESYTRAHESVPKTNEMNRCSKPCKWHMASCMILARTT